jgi:hypothetical protein
LDDGAIFADSNSPVLQHSLFPASTTPAAVETTAVGTAAVVITAMETTAVVITAAEAKGK